MVPQNIRLNVDEKPAQVALIALIKSRFKRWETQFKFFTLTLDQCVKIWSKKPDYWQQLICLTHPHFIHDTRSRNSHSSLTFQHQFCLLKSTLWQCCKVLPLNPSAWKQFDRE